MSTTHKNFRIKQTKLTNSEVNSHNTSLNNSFYNNNTSNTKNINLR